MFFIWMKISQVVAFDGLGETTKNSLATEKGRFRPTEKRDKRGFRPSKANGMQNQERYSRWLGRGLEHLISQQKLEDKQ